MRRCFAVQLVAVLILACTSALAETPTVRYLGSFKWDMDVPWFGGFSALALSADGQSMTVVSDRTKILTARIVRQSGQITAIKPGVVHHLKSSTGARLTGPIADSEGIAIAPDGTLYISFESVARIASYSSLGSTATPLHRHTDFQKMRVNGSLEALAIDRKGRLYTLPEHGADAQGKIPVFRWNGKRWSWPFSLPARGKFRPVGADFGPDGKFYLLERTFGLFGFRTRLRRWDITETAATNEITLLETKSGAHDNLEGLSVWRDKIGQIRITMISDDNFMFFQRTELVEYALTE